MTFEQLKADYNSINLNSFMNVVYKENILDAAREFAAFDVQKNLWLSQEYRKVAEYAQNLGYQGHRMFAAPSGSKAAQLIQKAEACLDVVHSKTAVSSFG